MIDPQDHWPATLWVVRHGQSAGNVAREAAEAAGAPVIDLDTRDTDTVLSPLGEDQARALGEWFGEMAPAERPTVVLCSPYVRAQQTARLLIDAARLADVSDTEPPLLRCDERLREKEFGILDRLTTLGIRAQHPALSEQRRHVGKFYFRPPGGESWCDVILRLRSVVEMVSREYARERVLVVAHQVTVNCLRYLLEELTEQEILAIDAQGDVPNCAVTRYDFDARIGRRGGMALHEANFVAPLREAGAPVTAEPDVAVAPKA